MRTYLVEPQSLFVPYLVAQLFEGGFNVVATNIDLDLKDIVAVEPAAVIVDVDFFERGGPNAISRIRQAMRAVTIVALSGLEDPTFAASCSIAGANAVVWKRDGLDGLITGLRAATAAAAAAQAARVPDASVALLSDVRAQAAR
jgi:DNA-binding NarL/FixJ family response regulator